LIAGTSTGGIIALGLSIGMRPQQIVEFYSAYGPRIFPYADRSHWIKRLRGPRYEPAPLRVALRGAFGDRRLADAQKRLVIPSYDIGENAVHLFRTPHSQRLNRDFRVPMVDVALATSAAPTYLAAHRLGHSRLIDGGVWANNPTMVAVTEAGGELRRPLSSVRVLSLGTTSETKALSAKLDRGGLIAWGKACPGVFLDGQAMTAYNQAYHLLGAANILRIDPLVPESQFRMDLVHDSALLSKAAKASRDNSPTVAEKFVDHVAPEYVPYRSSAEVNANA